MFETEAEMAMYVICIFQVFIVAGFGIYCVLNR